MGIFGDILGAGAGMAGMIFGSSEKIKDIDGDVELSLEDAAQLFDQSKSKAYSYTGDDTGTKFIGPTAEDMQQVTGAGDGQTIDARNMLGLHHAAIGKLLHEVMELKGGAPAGGPPMERQARPQQRQAMPVPNFSLSEI